MTLARQSKLRGWWQKYGGVIPAWFEVYVGLEEEASEIRSYQCGVLYGLLQTERYARDVLNADETVPELEGERRLEVRLKRQELLVATDAPKLWSVVDEEVLRRQVGGREVMRDQLLHLIAISKRPGMTIQVIPNEAGAHPSMDALSTVWMRRTLSA